MSQPRTVFEGTPLQLLEEDAGLAALLGSQSVALAREVACREPAVLQAVRDVLQSAFAVEGRRQYLDPFAPAAARNGEVVAALRAAIAEHRQRGGVLARIPNDAATLETLFAATLGWGPAQRYLDDPRVQELKIIGRHIRVQEAGAAFVTAPELFDSADEVQSRALLLAAVLGVRLDAETPQATLPVAHGTRMHISIPPRTVDGALVCIRRGRRAAWDLADLHALGAFDQQVSDVLALLSQARCSMLIAGRTGSGKTGLLEGLANSWPGYPHIVTIEDHTMEIGIRRTDCWTRELVDTQRDPLAFGRVAREALRQTPDLLLPGEIRGNEAGAVLALVLSDHPVLSTLHARSCAEAIERFAACAALPGAYMYEGRRDDALRDACAGFDVVIRVDSWESIGRRLITEVALVDGCAVAHGTLVPRVIPLVTATLQHDRTVSWECAARAGDDGQLEWHDSADLTPPALRERLARAQAQVYGQAPSLDVVAEALSRAERLLLAGAAERALATLADAWAQRRDERLMSAALRAQAQAPDLFVAVAEHAAEQMTELEQLMQAHCWQAAHAAYDRLVADLATAAVAAPAGGWEPLAAAIEAGLAQLSTAAAAQTRAVAALEQGQPGVAIDILRALVVSKLPRSLALPILRVREQALAVLLERGVGSAEVLRTVRAQRSALEHVDEIE